MNILLVSPVISAQRICSCLGALKRFVFVLGGHSLQVLWLPWELRDLVQELDPALLQTSGRKVSVEELQENKIVKLNLHYSSMSEEQIR